MADKSPRKGTVKKASKTLKEKRAAKKLKHHDAAGFAETRQRRR